VPKKRKLHKNELNTTFFCSTSPPKGSKWLKICKISLTFRFDKLSNSSKSVHTGENSQILTVSNKKIIKRIYSTIKCQLIARFKAGSKSHAFSYGGSTGSRSSVCMYLGLPTYLVTFLAILYYVFLNAR
jgi:hypothetical protein